MRKSLSVALLLLAWPAWGQTVTMPAEVKVPRGRLAVVEATYDGAGFRYVVVGTDADCFREYTDDPATVRLRVLAYSDGVVSVIAYCAKGDKTSPPAVCKVIVGDGPAPPVPPVPPTPPPDTDPLVAGFQAHYDADANPGKAAEVPALSKLYLLAASTLANDPAIKSNAELVAKMKDAQAKLMDAGMLVSLRGRIAVELDEVLGSSTTRVDRDKAAALFTRVSRCLDQIQLMDTARKGRKK